MTNAEQRPEAEEPAPSSPTSDVGLPPKAHSKLDWPKLTSDPVDMNRGATALLPELCSPACVRGHLRERSGSPPSLNLPQTGALALLRKDFSLEVTGLLKAKERINLPEPEENGSWAPGDGSGHLSLVIKSAAEPPQAVRKEAHSCSTALGTWTHFRAMSRS